MKHLLSLLLFLFFLSSQAQQLVINELMASNGTTIADEDGDYEDWIEIYNNDAQPVNLTGYGLSDDAENRFRWVFPHVTIQPGEYLLVWASGKDRNTPGYPLHTNFRISASGEPVSLTKVDGTLLDYVPETQLPRDVSYGRYPNATGAFHYFYQPTPNAANTTTALAELLTLPDFSHEAGFYNSPIDLAISHPNPDISIIYTLDGSEPKPDNMAGKTYPYKNSYPSGDLLTNSFQTHTYHASIPINDRTNEPNKISAISTTRDSNASYLPDSPVKKATVVKARVVQNGIEGPIKTATFFISDSNAFHFNNLPIISMSFNEDDLFDYNNGIYVAGKDFVTNSGGRICGYGNYNRRGRENEKKSYFEFFKNSTRFYNQGVGIRIVGNCSRNLAFKSTRIVARYLYDENNLMNHWFFDHHAPPASLASQQFKRLTMRSPNSYDYAFSGLYHGIFEGILGRIQPAIQFLNGELWGLTLIRDRFDSDHLLYNHGLNPDNIAILKIGYGWDVGQPGQEHMNRVWYISEGNQDDLDDFFDMKDFVVKNDMSNPELYQLANQRIDIESYVNHMILKTFAGDNHYAPEIVFWKARNAENDNLGDGRWRVFVKDFDAATSISNNIIQSFADGTYPRRFGAEIFTSLLKNEDFQTVFINRFADLLNSFLTTQRFDQIINDIFDNISPVWTEIQTGRWNNTRLSNPSRGFDDSHRNNLLNWSNVHPPRQREHIRSFFNIPANQNITLNVSDDKHGHIKINTIDILENTPGIAVNPYPWTGIYFHGIPITVTALPKEGYQFSHWTGASSSSELSISITPTADVSLMAHFVPEPQQSGQIIHYWLMDESMSNNTPLENMATTYTTMVSDGLIEYHSCLAGYPFSENHPNWRKASMERRNSPTSLNYSPDANNGMPYGSFMRGLQIKQPFQDNGRENIVNFSFSTEGYEDIRLTFAVKDEGAAEAIIAEYWDTASNQWTSDFLPNAIYDITPSYKLVEIDFSNVTDAGNNPNFQCRLRFDGTDMTTDNGNRVTFNNISVSSKTTVNSDYTVRQPDKVSYYPNPTTGKLHVSSQKEIQEIIIFNLLGVPVFIHQPNSTSFALDLSHLPAATYLMKVRSSAKNLIFKVSKQ